MKVIENVSICKSVNPLRAVDPFHGNGTIDLPEPQGIAASWFFLKAQSGNTHPGACYPFGLVSACPYSGAYVTGYGLNGVNTHGTPPRIHDAYTAVGFTHFHQSGTGYTGIFYNYVKVMPLTGGLRQIGARYHLEDEKAAPGEYYTRLGDTGMQAELTVGPTSALHRYTFHDGASPQLALDLSAGGLECTKDEDITRPSEAEVCILSARTAHARIVMEGIPLYVWIETDISGNCSLWEDQRPLEGSRLSRKSIAADAPGYGIVFSLNHSRAVLRLGFSFESAERARDHITEPDFDTCREQTRIVWEEYLGRIQVEGGSPEKQAVFYSSLYHSLIKPASVRDENPFGLRGVPGFFDFATMWDQYKTLLPLIFTISPEDGADIARTLIGIGRSEGRLPCGIMLCKDLYHFENQARALPVFSLADAWFRRLKDVDWEAALDVMLADIHQARNKDFHETGVAHPFTHTLDMAGACHCVAELAAGLGRKDVEKKMRGLAGNWINVYDPATGRLGESMYYEGGAWNYSFRLLHDMPRRIGLYPSAKAFAADLDLFFGYGQPAVKQAIDPADHDYMKFGFSLNRFEGYNNEPDMEVPYAYVFAGRHDRTAEIVRAGMKYMYTTGRGGLPGNNDSGGLSSMYVWNALGLFPVTGQSCVLIGSSLFDRVTLTWGGSEGEILARNNSEENIYVRKARLNGRDIDTAVLNLDDLKGGFRLELEMGDRPSGWAAARSGV